MPLDDEDLALQDRLRQKYAAEMASNRQQEISEGNELGVDMSKIIANQLNEDQKRLTEMKNPNAVPDTQDNRGQDPKYDIKVCMACNGDGFRKNYYNNREIVEHCTSCDGDGIIKRDNKTGQRVKSDPVVTYNSKPKLSPAKMRKKLAARVEGLAKKVKGYRVELVELQTRMEASEDETEKRLIDGVITEIEKKVEDMEAKIVVKEAEMEKIPMEVDLPQENSAPSNSEELD
mmetsp:Transcript_24661/g.29861  ORF Transcript_24661/g.29861 Transcript_24661/m.29861 type:complete len:232 (-) Transcript_24661:98-793(-)|eukprot:CAMPEP_0197850774 /NCGR_PEP_ID=MMETSP1438-20131217/16352_1 /TAXON_ID=1461541 /ORGANISM="Pterosperma sp., Strain CCMP1384" /LENGTH=231 /DNA_ID=CAMNT_0043464121 /DNA_START=224 /DNA_END=919 /DNA_ORIENTATION=+